MRDQVFGNSSAEKDDLLYQCPVLSNTPESEKSIISGRWGTGKSAILLLAGEQLDAKLKSIDPKHERIWYVTESSLDIYALLELERQFHDNAGLLRRAMEAAWRGTIVRTYAHVLSVLADTYSNTRGQHWTFIQTIGKAATPTKMIWENMGKVIKILGGGTEREIAFDGIQRSLSHLIQQEAIDNIMKCLQDIDPSAGEVIPIIAVEPIETPTSTIEDEDSLANELVVALQNVFLQSFQPTSKNRIDLRIALPWHRQDPTRVDFPQKFRQYIGHVRWTRSRLREFINRRIEWEFKRVGRRFIPHKNQDAWTELFGTNIHNGVCKPRVDEDSFDYFLRHTHHRPRDLQTLARIAVERQAHALGIGVDDVIRGSIRSSLDPEAIKDAFRREGPSVTKEILIESGRRYPEIHIIEPLLRGFSIPFSANNLRNRIEKATLDFNDAVRKLWSSGILGFTAVPKTNKASDLMKAFLTDDSKRVYTNEDGVKLERWSFFDYNFDGNIMQLVDHLENMEDVETGFILHSKTIEYFSPHTIDTLIPIGV